MPQTPTPEAGGQRKTPAELRADFLDLMRFMGEDGPEIAAMLDELLEATSRERAAAQLREAADACDEWPKDNHASLLRNKAGMLDGTI